MTRDKTAMLEKEVLHLKQLIGELKRTDTDGTAGEGSAEAAGKGADMQRLQQELTECYKRNSENAQELLELNRKVKELTAAAAAKQDQLTTVERMCEGLKVELRERVMALNILTPELDSLKVELARAEARSKTLEEENAHLLNRWRLKVSEEAKKMNEANEFYHQVQQMAKNPLSLSNEAMGGAPHEIQPTDDRTRKARSHGSSVPRRVHTRLRAHTGDVSSVTYDPAGERIASGSADTTVKVWRANGELLSTLSGAKLAITQVEFAPGGDMVLASSCDAVARLWNLSNAKIKHTLTGHVGKVMGATFVSAEKIVTGSQDRTVKVWDLGKGYCVRTVFCYSPCNAVAVVGESTRMLCSAHADRRVRLWDLKTADPVAEIQDVQSKQATSISWSPVWEYLVLTTAPDNTAQLIDLRNQKSAHTFRPPQGGVLSPQACFSADGNFVAAGSTTGGVFVWNTHTAALEAHITEGHQAGVSSCTWGARGKPLVTGGSDASLLVWS